MATSILMPALSPTMEKGNLARWLKKEGDAIKSGDVIAEIETDKATMEVEAVDEGILAKILVAEGTADVPVNEIIGMIAGEGEDPASVAAAPSSGGAAAPAAAQGAPPPASSPPGGASAAEQQAAGERGYGVTPGAAPVASSSAPPASPAPKANGAAPAGGEGARVFASPLARRVAKQEGVDLSQIKGSGPHGRIVEKDVRAALVAGPAAAPAPVVPAAAPAATSSPAAAPRPATPAGDDTVRKLFAPGSFTEIPHDGMRRTIARRLTEAKQTIPHFYLTIDCELDALLALREQINAAAPQKDGKPSYKISVNDMVIKALAMSLRAVPDANVSWTDSAMLKHATVDVGVAVSIPGGLITPVIRDAAGKTLSSISNEMKDLAGRAKARKLKPEEYQGGTTAVSNLGMFGVKSFSAVINPPHATILAVGAGEKRVVAKNGAPAVATLMSVTLSTDHRAVDGALGAELMQAFKGFIESPMGMLV